MLKRDGFTMNGREDQYTWLTPYVDNSQVVIVKKGSGIHKLTDPADYNSAFLNMGSGMVDAIAMDIGVASYQLSKKDGARILFLTNPRTKFIPLLPKPAK